MCFLLLVKGDFYYYWYIYIYISMTMMNHLRMVSSSGASTAQTCSSPRVMVGGMRRKKRSTFVPRHVTAEATKTSSTATTREMSTGEHTRGRRGPDVARATPAIRRGMRADEIAGRRKKNASTSSSSSPLSSSFTASASGVAAPSDFPLHHHSMGASSEWTAPTGTAREDVHAYLTPSPSQLPASAGEQQQRLFDASGAPSTSSRWSTSSSQLAAVSSSAAASASAAQAAAPEEATSVDVRSSPLERMRMLGLGWVGVVIEYEGVLVESTLDVELAAWKTLAAELNIGHEPNEFALWRAQGMFPEHVVSQVLCWTRNPTRVNDIVRRFAALVKGATKEQRLMPGVKAILRSLRNTGDVAFAVVSSSPSEDVRAGLAANGVEDIFMAQNGTHDDASAEAVVVGCDNVMRGRPDPEAYDLAASLMKRCAQNNHHVYSE